MPERIHPRDRTDRERLEDFFQKRGGLFALEWGGQDHARGGAAVGEQALDEALELRDVGKNCFEEEGVAAGEVVTFLNVLQGGEELQKGAVTAAVAGEPDERRDGVSEGFKVNLNSIAANDIQAFQLPDALCCCGSREANAAAEFGEGEAGVERELVQNLFVDGIEDCVWHRKPPSRSLLPWISFEKVIFITESTAYFHFRHDISLHIDG